MGMGHRRHEGVAGEKANAICVRQMNDRERREGLMEVRLNRDGTTDAREGLRIQGRIENKGRRSARERREGERKREEI